jgi:hypothetical protein
MKTRLCVAALSTLAAVLPFSVPTPALAAANGPDLALVSLRASSHKAHAGDLITFKVVAVNNGHGQADQAVTARDVHGLTLVSATCAFGVSSDGPGDCEYGNTKVGKPFTTTFVAQAGAPTKDQKTATLVVCTQNLSGGPDPVPGNDCRSATIKLRR